MKLSTLKRMLSICSSLAMLFDSLAYFLTPVIMLLAYRLVITPSLSVMPIELLLLAQ